MNLPLAKHCRLSGESLENARVLFELPRCPLPGIYPDNAVASLEMTSPLRVVQAQGSGFVQLAHVLDGAIYKQYAFAGSGAVAYREYLEWFAQEVAGQRDEQSAVLEVGCGDGWLLSALRKRGFQDVLGIDPSRAAHQGACSWLIAGFFPDDLSEVDQYRKRDLIVCRHVIEHIETPLTFMNALASSLSPSGELWVEVPDLDSTVERGIWSNFYQIHCNYFSASTLDQLAANAGLRCVGGRVVEIFGGSLLRRYVLGTPHLLKETLPLKSVSEKVARYKQNLINLSERMPTRSVGYGAAERTAVMIGMAPELGECLNSLYDGNPLLTGRFLAGTRLKIRHKEALFADQPPGIVLFAISNTEEILSEWRGRLDGSTLVGIAGSDFSIKPLSEYL